MMNKEVIWIYKERIVLIAFILLLVPISNSSFYTQATEKTSINEYFLKETQDYLTIQDLNWHFGFFENTAYNGGFINASDYFTQESNDSYIHVREEKDTYKLNIGAYALVPVNQSYVNFTFEAKIKADVADDVKLAVVLLDPITLNYIDGGKWIYHHGVVLETDWMEYTVNYPIKEFDQVYLFFYYSDSSNSITHQEFWIRNLEVTNNSTHTLVETLDSSPTYTSIDEFEWTVGTYSRDLSIPLTAVDHGEYEYSTTTELHLLENGSGTYDAFVGAYARVPLLNGYLKYYAEIRVKASTTEGVSFKIIAYKPNTFEVISSNIITDFDNPGVLDTGYVIKNDLIYIGNYINVTLLFCYEDSSSSNLEQEFWVRNLQVATLTNWTSPIEENETETQYLVSQEDLNWLPGTFSSEKEFQLTLINGGEYFYELSPELHMSETGSGTFDTSVGFIALVPLSNGFCNYSVEVRAKADSADSVSLGVRIYNPETLMFIDSNFEMGFYNPGVADTGYVEKSKDVYIGDYDEVLMLIYYLDGYTGNQQHEFWIKNLQIEVGRNWTCPEDPPDIPGIADDEFEENDDFPSAVYLDINSSYNLFAFDDDYFKFELTELYEINIVLNFTNDATDLDLYLCDYEGNIIAESKTYESIENIEHLTLYSGVYYVVVILYDGEVGTEYTLKTTITDTGLHDDKYEDNEYLDDAPELQIGQTYNLFYLDYDIFKIILQDDDYIEIEITFDASIIDLDIYLLPENFSGDIDEILAGSESSSSPELIKYKAEYSGVYYIFIVAYLGEDGEDPLNPSAYTMKLSNVVPEESVRDSITIPFSGLAMLIAIFSLVAIYKRTKNKLH